MAVVQLMIGGQKYAVSCGDGQEENLKELALMLDEKVMRIKSGAHVPEALGLVMGGLLLANDLAEAREEMAARSKEQPLVSAEVLGRLTQMMENAANRISAVAETSENA